MMEVARRITASRLAAIDCALPPVNRQVIHNHVRGTAAAGRAVKLNIYQKRWRPSQIVCTQDCHIDSMLDSIERDGFVGNPACIVAGVAELYVMPCVRGPATNIARHRRMGPGDIR